MPQTTQIPDKLYFKIGEVSQLLKVEPYVLRYWETEFKEIHPVKSRTNQRLYKRRDVELLLQIRELLYGHKFTINGARKKLRERGGSSMKEQGQMGLELNEQTKPSDSPKIGKELKNEILSLIEEMENDLKNL